MYTYMIADSVTPHHICHCCVYMENVQMSNYVYLFNIYIFESKIFVHIYVYIQYICEMFKYL